MKRALLAIPLALATLLLAAALPALPVGPDDARLAPAPAAAEALASVPLAFEPNVGQTDPAVRFLARAPGQTLFLTDEEAVLALNGAPRAALRLSFPGASPRAPEALGTAEGRSHYLLGNDPSAWRADVPRHARVVYRDLHPGVDLVFYGAPQRQIEYDLVLAPGADPARVRVALEGADALRVDEAGDLVARVGAQELRQTRPVAYQAGEDGAREPVAASFALLGPGEYGFRVGEYDRARPLVIDPVLVYSTYLGGSGWDTAWDVDVDAEGYAYVTGETASLDFPVTPGAFQPADPPGTDAFVAKLDPTGNLVYATYLGGRNLDVGEGIAVDAGGNAVVTGYTRSPDFPLAAAFQGVMTVEEVFVTKLDPTGGAPVFSTYMGGWDEDRGTGVDLDAFGGIYVTGWTRSWNFPIAGASPYQPAWAGRMDAFLARITPAGALFCSTYVGGPDDDWAAAIATEGTTSNDFSYLTGRTHGGFPVTPGAFQPVFGGAWDAFAVKMGQVCQSLVYATYLGGPEGDTGWGIDEGPGGEAYVTGDTASGAAFPTLNPTQAPGGGRDAFLTRLTSTGAALVFSTPLGGVGDEGGEDVAADAAGDAYVTGHTDSLNYPVAGVVPQPVFGGFVDAFVTKVNGGGGALAWSTFLGGDGSDYGRGIALDARGATYAAGQTNSPWLAVPFPTTPGVHDTTFNGGIFDAFVAKMA